MTLAFALGDLWQRQGHPSRLGEAHHRPDRSPGGRVTYVSRYVEHVGEVESNGLVPNDAESALNCGSVGLTMVQAE